jgi:RND family efflux transporter MFP subunit
MNRLLIVFVLMIALPAAAQSTAVVVMPVKELAVGEPVVVNGVIRSRHDILLPATVDGRLKWVLEEGSRVRKGSVVAKVDDAQLTLRLREQELLADRARINVSYLQGEVDRLSRLQESNLASKTQLAEIVSRRDLAANDLSVAQARIAELEESLSRTEIIAPEDAVVVERIRQGGEYARSGESVLRVVNPHALEVLISIPVTWVNHVDAGQPVSVSVGDAKFESSVRSVIHASDPASQTFDALAEVPLEAARSMIAGQFAEVEMPLSRGKRSLFVPRDAIVLRSDGNYVYRIDEGNVAKRVVVTLGEGQGDLVAVSGDLSAGDSVAVRGVERLQDGQTVTPANS